MNASGGMLRASTNRPLVPQRSQPRMERFIVTTRKRSKADGGRATARARRGAAAGSSADSFTPPLIDVVRAFLDHRAPLTAASASVLRESLEPWIGFLRTYRKTLDGRAAPESPEDQLRQVARALLSSYLEFFKAHPERGRGFIALQAQLVDAYLETLEAALRSADRPERPSRRKPR